MDVVGRCTCDQPQPVTLGQPPAVGFFSQRLANQKVNIYGEADIMYVPQSAKRNEILEEIHNG